MECCIHRGAHEIGASCVELACEGQSIVLDCGAPLDGSPAAFPADGNGRKRLAVFISHAHLDHYGLIEGVPAALPVYMSPPTRRLLEAAARFSPQPLRLPPTRPFTTGRPVEVGPFRITPFLVDHSAYDAHGFLIQAGGKAVFYSGDLRAHGRKAGVFDALLARGPRGVDVMLLEGTTLTRPTTEGPLSEAALEDILGDDFAQTPGLALALFAGQNVDRLVTVYRAAQAAGRTLVVDPYLAHLVEALDRASLPQPAWGRGKVRVFTPLAQRRRLRTNGHAELLARYRAHRIGERELAAHPARYVATVRTSWRPALDRAGCLAGARLSYGLWPGYLQRPEDGWAAWCEARGVPVVLRHTSGHAAPGDLAQLVAALAPRRVVPIHTEAPGRYATLFPHAAPQPDGTWWSV